MFYLTRFQGRKKIFKKAAKNIILHPLDWWIFLGQIITKIVKTVEQTEFLHVSEIIARLLCLATWQYLMELNSFIPFRSHNSISSNICLLNIFAHLLIRPYFLNMIIQPKEPEFPGEVVDFRAGAEKTQDDPRATCRVR